MWREQRLGNERVLLWFRACEDQIRVKVRVDSGASPLQMMQAKGGWKVTWLLGLLRPCEARGSALMTMLRVSSAV